MGLGRQIEVYEGPPRRSGFNRIMKVVICAAAIIIVADFCLTFAHSFLISYRQSYQEQISRHALQAAENAQSPQQSVAVTPKPNAAIEKPLPSASVSGDSPEFYPATPAQWEAIKDPAPGSDEAWQENNFVAAYVDANCGRIKEYEGYTQGQVAELGRAEWRMHLAATARDPRWAYIWPTEASRRAIDELRHGVEMQNSLSVP